MQEIASNDGTKIAYDKTGQGPVVILVTGATGTRNGHMAQLANLLSGDLTVINYDRRGRGDSGDTKPYSLLKETQDIEALIDSAGGSACLFGISSGGALVLETAANLGDKIKKIAVYEVPYDDSEPGIKLWTDYRADLAAALNKNDRGLAVTLFMKMGVPEPMIENMRQSPMWQSMEALAPTLEYDAEALGDMRTVPTDKLSSISAQALIIEGGASSETMPFMKTSADLMAKSITNAQRLTLPDQRHDVDPAVLAPALLDFFKSLV
jgi:pimeloyl-ACP methyl ester carboxylesterase